MQKRNGLLVPLFAACLCAWAPFATAAIVVPGADGSDGIFNPNASVTIDLSRAATGAWDSASPVAGRGVYDPAKWAVVFKYQRVIIREGVTITFTNHPSGAPVVWLVSESVTVDGSISLDGVQGHEEGNRSLAIASPGGFRGGMGSENLALGGGGFGPGGAYYDPARHNHGNHGVYAVETGQAYEWPSSRLYGNARIMPLIGGSGGGGGNLHDTRGGGGGGSGGGAILIAVQGALTISGQITANGGPNRPATHWGGSGSGGAIRIIADAFQGSGQLRAVSVSTGAHGRIRVEANSVSYTRPGEPAYTAGFPGETAELWPAADVPSVRMVTLGGVPVPSEPLANLVDFSQADVPVATEDFATLVIETTNVDQFADVKVRVTPLAGANLDYLAFYDSTNVDGVSRWTVDLPLGQGFSAIQVRVVTP